MKKLARWLRKSQSGQTATEYMLIIGVIVVGLLAAANTFIEPFQDAVHTVGEKVKICVETGECGF